MIARVLLVGDELLGGTISDLNASTIARAFGPRGVPVVGVEIVGDEESRIADAVQRLAADCDVLVITGGLGPTVDDLTRDGIARALGVDVVENEKIRAGIEQRLRAHGVERPAESVRRQAHFPVGTDPVRNPAGSAPGFTGRLGDCQFWSLPGVPQEVIEMIPAIVETLPDPGPEQGWERMIATAGLGEIRVAERLEDAGFEPPDGIGLAYLPSPGGVRLRLFAPSGAPAIDLDKAEERLRDLLGSWGLSADSIQASLVTWLAKTGGTLATAESCTGGLIGARITDVPGASSVYCGGVVAYSNRIKTSRLSVPAELLEEHGAVSEEVARAMASGVRTAFDATLAISVTGIAGPDGGTPDKPVGTVWIAGSDDGGEWARRFLFRGNRAMVRERTVNKALEMAYRRERERPS